MKNLTQSAYHRAVLPALFIAAVGVMSAFAQSDDADEARRIHAEMQENLLDREVLATLFQESESLSEEVQEAMIVAFRRDRLEHRTSYRQMLGQAVVEAQKSVGIDEAKIMQLSRDCRAEVEAELDAFQGGEDDNPNIGAIIDRADGEVRSSPQSVAVASPELEAVFKKAEKCEQVIQWFEQRLRPSGRRIRDGWGSSEDYLTTSFALPLPPRDRLVMQKNRGVNEGRDDFAAFELVRRFNLARVFLGSPALPFDPDLSEIATEHIRTVSGGDVRPITHDPAGEDPFDREPRFSRFLMEQHFFFGAAAASDAMDGLLGEQLYIGTLLDAEAQAVGVGRVENRWILIVQKKPIQMRR